MEKELTKALAEYPITPAKVAEMAKEYKDLAVIPDDIKSYKAVHSTKMILVKTRTGVDKRRKELGEDARKWVNAVNQAAKDLLAPITPIEDRFKEELAAEDARIEKVEADRVQAIRNKIDGIRAFYYTVDKTAKEIEIIYQDLLKYEPISEDNFQEFTHEAISVYNDTLAALITGKEIRLKFEQEEADRKAESERLEKVRKEQEAEAIRLKAISDAQEEERRKIQAEKDKIEADKKAEGNRIAREAFERQALDNARSKAEQEAKEKAEREEQKRIAREEAARKKKERKEALRPDKEKLIRYANALLDIIVPEVNSDEAGKIREYAIKVIGIEANEIIKQAEAL